MSDPTTYNTSPISEIDKAKWDHCIDNAGNGLIYAYSFYLDHMAKQLGCIGAE